MGHVNKVLLIGRVEAQPTLTKTKDGGSIVVLSLCTDVPSGDARCVTRHTVQVFDREAETCADQLAAGRLVYVEGRIADDGVIVASQIHFLGRKPA